jgi:hypothetical protein
MASKLIFSDPIKSLCYRARNRARNLVRNGYCPCQNPFVLLFNSYIVCIFSYAAVVWMICSKKFSGEINSIHNLTLRAACFEFLSSYEIFLQNSGCKRMYEIHIFHLVYEVYKTLRNFNPFFVKTLFEVKSRRYRI